MKDPRQAAVDWITEQIQIHLPHEQQPTQLAIMLDHIAELQDVPTEAVIAWLQFRMPGKHFTTDSFSNWAKKYAETRAAVSAIRADLKICQQCGMPIQYVGITGLCACPQPQPH